MSEEWSGAEEDVGDKDVIPVATLVIPPSTKKRNLIVLTPVPRILGSPFKSGASRRPKLTLVAEFWVSRWFRRVSLVEMGKRKSFQRPWR